MLQPKRKMVKPNIPTSIVENRKGKNKYKAEDTEVVKAASGAQLLGAVAPMANLIPRVGTIAAPLLSGVASMWGASDAKKEQAKLLKEQSEGMFNQKSIEDAYALDNYNTKGVNDISRFNKGGKINKTPQPDIATSVYNRASTSVTYLPTVKVDDIVKLPSSPTNTTYTRVNIRPRERLMSSLPRLEVGGVIEEEETLSNKPSTTGKFDTVGGDLLPISDDAQVVSGNTHKENKIDGSYGVTLSADGQPIANVEDKEVIVDNDLVFSDKLKKGKDTFADIALGVNAKIGELQDKLKGAKSNAEKFSLERTIQGLEKTNQNLFNEQEIVKSNTVGEEVETVKVEDGIVPKGATGLNLVSELKSKSYNKYAYPKVTASTNIQGAPVYYKDPLLGIGDKKPNVLGQIAPLLADNITNAILTANAPKPGKVIPRKTPIFDTTVNVNPQIAKIEKAVGSASDEIRGNTSNSNVTRANIAATKLKGAELASDVYARQEEAEKSLKNKQIEAVTSTANLNAGLQEDYNTNVREHMLQQNASQSRNVVDVVQDYKDVKTGELQDKQNQDIVNLSLMDDPTGEKLRRFRRLGKNLSTEDKVMLLQEINRKK